MSNKRIRCTCFNPGRHPFPVRMRYGGSVWQYGRRVHVMYCPVCGCRRLYEYLTPWYYRRVA